MSGYMKMIIVGNVGRNPETRFLPSGTQVTNFSVAVNRVWGSGENRKEQTTWVRVAAFGQLAEICNNYVTKGKLLLIEGRVEVSAFIDKETGAARGSLELTAENVQFLGAKGDNEGSNGGTADEAGAPPSDLSDIPF